MDDENQDKPQPEQNPSKQQPDREGGGTHDDAQVTEAVNRVAEGVTKLVASIQAQHEQQNLTNRFEDAISSITDATAQLSTVTQNVLKELSAFKEREVQSLREKLAAWESTENAPANENTMLLREIRDALVNRVDHRQPVGQTSAQPTADDEKLQRLQQVMLEAIDGIKQQIESSRKQEDSSSTAAQRPEPESPTSRLPENVAAAVGLGQEAWQALATLAGRTNRDPQIVLVDALAFERWYFDVIDAGGHVYVQRGSGRGSMREVIRGGSKWRSSRRS